MERDERVCFQRAISNSQYQLTACLKATTIHSLSLSATENLNRWISSCGVKPTAIAKTTTKSATEGMVVMHGLESITRGFAAVASLQLRGCAEVGLGREGCRPQNSHPNAQSNAMYTTTNKERKFCAQNSETLRANFTRGTQSRGVVSKMT